MLNTSSKKIAKIHFRNGYYESNINSNTLDYIISKSKFKDKRIDFFLILMLKEMSLMF